MSHPWYHPSEEIISILNKFDVNGFESPGGTDKNTIHNYTGIYAHVLEHYREKAGTLLELGVQHGGSSLLWHEFLPKFQLHLVDIADIAPSKIWHSMNPDRHTFYNIDGYNSAAAQKFEKEVPEGFDIIIDDGPHTVESQVFAVDFYFPMLKPDGILIIEDIQDSSHLNILTAHLEDRYQEDVRTFDVRRTKGRYDDLIWTVTKSK